MMLAFANFPLNCDILMQALLDKSLTVLQS